MVNKHATNMPYMRASGNLNWKFGQKVYIKLDLSGGRTRIRTRVAGLEGQSDIQLHYTSKPAQKKLFDELWGRIATKVEHIYDI